MIKNNNIFGKLIRKRRLERNLTLSKVGKAIGRSIAYIHDLEKGYRSPPVRTPEKFALLSTYLDIPLETLLDAAGITLETNSKETNKYIKIIKNRSIAVFFGAGMASLREQIGQIASDTEVDSKTRKRAQNALETVEALEANLKSVA